MMIVPFELVRDILSKQTKKLHEEELERLEKWLIEQPYFKAIAESDQQSLAEVSRLIDRATITGEFVLAREQSVEWMVVLAGKVEVVKKSYPSPSKKKRKQAPQPKEESLGVFKEGDWRENIGQCRLISPRGTTANIAYLSLRSRDKVLKGLNSRKTQEKLKLLQSLSLFEPLEKKLLKRLAEQAVYRTFYLNNCIYRINDPVDSGCFVLLEGSVKVVKQHVEKELWNPPFRRLKMEMSILSPKQLFGEEELLSGAKKRIYSVACTTETVRLLEIPKEEFVNVMQSHFKHTGGEEIKQFEKGRAYLRNSLLARNSRIFEESEEKSFPPLTERQLPMFNPRPKRPLNDFTADLGLSHYLDKSLEQREFKLIKNAHMILQALPTKRREGGVVRSSSSMAEYPSLSSGLPRLSGKL